MISVKNNLCENYKIFGRKLISGTKP